MKYFTKKLILDSRNTSDEVWQQANAKWEKNLNEYIKQLKSLENRLSKKAYQFFLNTSLHDGCIIHIKINDNDGIRYLNPKIRKRKIPTSLEIKVIDGASRFSYCLSYSNVTKFSVNLQSSEPLFYLHDENDIIGTWAYDELTAYSSKMLKHEILFQSGSELSIVFDKIKIDKSKILKT